MGFDTFKKIYILLWKNLIIKVSLLYPQDPEFLFDIQKLIYL